MVQLLPVCSTWKSLMTKPLGMAALVFRVTVKKGVTLTQTAFLSKSCLSGCQRKLRLGFLLRLIMHLDADMNESQLRKLMVKVLACNHRVMDARWRLLNTKE